MAEDAFAGRLKMMADRRAIMVMVRDVSHA
jgi:hypothetical protein